MEDAAGFGGAESGAYALDGTEKACGLLPLQMQRHEAQDDEDKGGMNPAVHITKVQKTLIISNKKSIFASGITTNIIAFTLCL